MFGCIIYFIWAQGEVQPWAIMDDDSSENTTVTIKDDGLSNPAFKSEDENFKK